MSTQAVTAVVRPADGVTHDLGGGLGARLLVAGGTTADRCSLVDHPMAPRTLGSPVHTHAREDEYSYVLEGAVTVPSARRSWWAARRPDPQASRREARLLERDR